jgi:hypothetical protein
MSGVSAEGEGKNAHDDEDDEIVHLQANHVSASNAENKTKKIPSILTHPTHPK